MQSDAGSCQDFEVIPDEKPGSTCSQTAAEVMTTNAFVRNASWSNLVLPWDTDFMSQIFSETSAPDPKLSLPSQWNAEVVTASPSKPDVSVPSVPVDSVFSKHVRQIKEETFWEQREKNSKHAIAKWILFLRSDLSASQVGLQIQNDEEDSISQANLLSLSRGVVVANRDPLFWCGRSFLDPVMVGVSHPSRFESAGCHQRSLVASTSHDWGQVRDFVDDSPNDLR